MAVSSAGARLLDRERELEELDALIEAAGRGRGGLVVLEGDAGIGKTALLEAAAGFAAAQGLSVLHARADALEAELSFGVCVQLLAPVTGEAGADDELFRGAAAFARSVLGDGTGFAGVPGEDRTLPLLNGLYWLCAHIAESSPLLLVVDDAHWADHPSLRFLHFVARRIEALPIAMIVATRPAGATSEGRELLAALAAQARTVVRPARLGTQAAAALVSAELGTPEPRFIEACLRLSGGNPLYLRELLHSAASRGMRPTGSDARALEELRPSRIADSVRERLASAGEPARRLAAMAAVGRGRLHLRDAAALAELDPRAAQLAADDLAALAILARGEPLALAHPLVQSAVYESIPAAARAGHHLRVAELLRDAGAAPEVVAAQLLSAERRAGTWVVDALEAAAATAATRGSPGAAATYLRRALEEGPAAERRAGVLVSLGLAETEAGDPEGAARLNAAVDLLPDSAARAGVLLGLGMTLTTQGEVERATAAYERGIAEIAATGGDVARDLEALCAIGLVHDREARAQALDRIERLLAVPGLDASPTGRLLLAQAAAERGYQGRSIAELRDLVGRALAPGLDEDDPTAFWVCVLAAYAFDDCDDYDRAEAAIERALAIARRRGSIVQATAACHPRAFVNLRRGRVDAALADARSSIEGAEHGWRVALPSSRALVAEAHLERGELELAAEAVRMPDGDGPWERLISHGWLLAARGRVELALNRPADALATLSACGELCAQARITNPSVIAWRSPAAVAAAQLGREERARELAEAELDAAGRFGAPRAIGAALRTLAMVAGGGDSVDQLRASAATLEDSPARLEQARSLVELGAALRRRGHRREAREPLREGHELAQRCGATALATRGLEELRAAGARPRRLGLTGVEALTASERRVTALAADGLSNPQVAQTLFVSRRTVEMHLTNAYRKLGIESREQLAGALAAATAEEPGRPAPAPSSP